VDVGTDAPTLAHQLWQVELHALGLPHSGAAAAAGGDTRPLSAAAMTPTVRAQLDAAAAVAVGHVVDGLVKHVTPVGAVIEVAGGQYAGFAVADHLPSTRPGVRMGQAVRAVVVDTDLAAHIVDLSLRPDLLAVRPRSPPP
jgi:hypothetical protein